MKKTIAILMLLSSAAFANPSINGVLEGKVVKLSGAAAGSEAGASCYMSVTSIPSPVDSTLDTVALEFGYKYTKSNGMRREKTIHLEFPADSAPIKDSVAMTEKLGGDFRFTNGRLKGSVRRLFVDENGTRTIEKSIEVFGLERDLSHVSSFRAFVAMYPTMNPYDNSNSDGVECAF